MIEDIFSEICTIVDGDRKQFNILLDGCWQCLEGAHTLAVHNPATGSLIGHVPQCTPADIARAIAGAAGSEEIAKKFSPLARLEIMEKAREILLEHRDPLARIITEESGKPIAISLGEVDATAERLKLTREEVRVLYGEYIPGEWVEDTRNKFAIVMRKPLGVVAAITSFNYPLFIPAAKIIPALLAGNTVVAKPSSETPLSLILFSRILEMAGMPKGSISIVTGRGSDVGDKLIDSPDISAVSFTGSTDVGEYIARRAGIKKLHLELGGKAAAIVLEDADLDNAAKHICKGAFRNSGQRCDAVSRVLVHKSVREKFVKKVLEETKNYKTGDPMDPKTAMGTVINKSAVERIDGLVKDALDRGARLLAGGGHQGLFYEATVLDGVTPDMRIAWEEIFGPVMPIMAVSGHDEALELSNRSEYGLDSCVFTENINHALKLARELQDGSTTINAMPAHGVGHFPFGGNKKSGLGREGLKYSIDELTKLHTVIFAEKG